MDQDRKLTESETREVFELMKSGMGMIPAKRLVIERSKKTEIECIIEATKNADSTEELREIMLDFLSKQRDNMI